MPFGINSTKRYLEQRNCKNLSDDVLQSEGPLPLIYVLPSSITDRKEDMPNTHPDTDFVAVLDARDVRCVGNNRYTFRYAQGYQYKIPSPVRDAKLSGELEKGTITASIDSLFEMSEEILQLIARTSPRQRGLG